MKKHLNKITFSKIVAISVFVLIVAYSFSSYAKPVPVSANFLTETYCKAHQCNTKHPDYAMCYPFDCEKYADKEEGGDKKTCTYNATLGKDNHCHCDKGYKKVTQEDADGRPHSCVKSTSCDDIPNEIQSLNKEYDLAKKELVKSQDNLALQSKLYQEAAVKNPNGVKAVGTFDNNKCKPANELVGCGGPQQQLNGSYSNNTSNTNTSSATANKSSSSSSGLTTRNSSGSTGSSASNDGSTGQTGYCPESAKCDQIDALLASTKHSICIINGQASLFATARGSSTATTSDTYVDNSFVINLSPNIVNQGDTVTVNATINSTSTKKYTITAYKDGASIGTLVNGVTVSSTSRPTSVTHSFKTSGSIPVGTYTIQISNDDNYKEYRNISLEVKPTGSSGTFFQNNSSTSANSLGSGATSNSSNSSVTKYSPVVSANSLVFLNPTSGTKMSFSSPFQAHWGYNNAVSGNIDLYLQQLCSNSDTSCNPVNVFIGTAPVYGVYYTFTPPVSFPKNVWAVLIAKQGSYVVGYSQTFSTGY